MIKINVAISINMLSNSSKKMLEAGFISNSRIRLINVYVK